MIYGFYGRTRGVIWIYNLPLPSITPIGVDESGALFSILIHSSSRAPPVQTLTAAAVKPCNVECLRSPRLPSNACTLGIHQCFCHQLRVVASQGNRKSLHAQAIVCELTSLMEEQCPKGNFKGNRKPTASTQSFIKQPVGVTTLNNGMQWPYLPVMLAKGPSFTLLACRIIVASAKASIAAGLRTSEKEGLTGNDGSFLGGARRGGGGSGRSSCKDAISWRPSCTGMETQSSPTFPLKLWFSGLGIELCGEQRQGGPTEGGDDQDLAGAPWQVSNYLLLHD